MAQDFEISVQRKGEDIHVKLRGDFDGISAHELLNALKTSCAPCSQVYIHTDSLRTLHPFGLQVFHSHFDVLKGTSLHLVFSGKHAFSLAPEKRVLFDLTVSTIPLDSQSETTTPTV
jgi:hypothetical protein